MNDTGKSSFVYVTYIRTTPQRLWQALTDPAFTPRYWFGARHQTDWKTGSPWRLVFEDGRLGDSGEVLEADPPRRLVLKWRNELMPDLKAEGYSRCTIELAPSDEAVKLTVTHEIGRPDAKFIQAVSGGWPLILSNLKSLIETGALAVTTKPEKANAA